MPITMQEEKKSSFTSSQTRSVEVIGGDSNTSNVGVGELYVPTNANTSNTMTNQQQQSVSSNVSSQNQSSRMEHDISSSTSASSINSDSTLKDFGISKNFGRDFTFRPLRNFDSSTMLARMSDFEDVSRDVYHVNDGDTFEMKLEVQDFKPEEIQVKISDNLVTIEGKQEDRKNESNFRSRQFSKKFTIPEGVKAESITCSITTEGQLKISAPIEQESSKSAVKSQNEANSVSSSTTASKQQQHKSQVTSTASRNVQRTETLSRESSINSDISSIRDTMSRGLDDEFILRPRMDMGSLMTRKESQFEDISKELCNVNDGKKFEMKLEVKNFKPEEIEVKITKNFVKIDGKHESEFASRSFHKEFTVPFGVKCDSIQCSITEDGILTISAPVQPVHEALASGVTKTQRSTEQEVTSSQKVSSKTQQQVQEQVRQQQKQTTQQQAVHSDSNTSINSNASNIRRFDDDFMIRPIMDFENLFAKDSRFEDVSKQLCQIQDEKKFEMKLDVPDFKPEELQVKISNNMVTIEGTQKTEFSSKQFFKKFSIPQGVKPESITSSLSPKGVLTISAPIQNQQPISNTTGTSDTRTTSSTTVEQQKQQSQSVLQQLKQQQQTQQQAVHSDSNTSVNSNISNIRDAVRRFDDDFMIRPIMDFENLMARDTRFEDVSKQICQVQDNKKFEMKLDVPDFKPEELQVKISNNMVTIEGNQKTEFSSKQFFKKFSIPQGVKPEDITSSLSPKGVLTISAPIQNQQSISNTTGMQDTKTTSSTTVEQQRQQSQSVMQQLKQQQQKQTTQQAVHSDSNTSINSNTSSIRDAVRRFDEDCMIRPIMDFENLFAKDSRFEDVSKQLCQIQEEKKFEMKLDVPDFKPEELEVKISNNMVTIQGKQEMKEENNFSSRQFFKKFSIPQNVKPETITSSLSPKGVLTISAPIQIQSQNQNQISNQQGSNISSKTTEQEVTSSRTTNVKSQQQKQTSISDSTSSINSNIASIRDATRRFDEDFMIRPIMDFDALLAKESHFEDISKQLCQVNEGKKFETKLDVPDFKPEELQVKISNNMVTIEGKQKTEFSSKQFFKKFSIPQGVKPESITSSLSPNGVLTISAPIELQSSNLNRNEQVTSAVSSSTTSSTRKEVQQQMNVSNQSNLRQELDNRTSNIDNSLSSIMSNAISNTKAHVFKPKMNLSDSIVAMNSQFEDVSKEVCHVNDGKHFEMKLEVQEFKPEEIDVKIANNMVTIEGKQEMREENNFRSRQFCKKFSIPQGVKAENITCSLSTDGKLTISAPIELTSALTSGSDNTTVVSQNQQQQQVQQQQSGQTSTSSVKKVSSTFSSTSSTTASGQY